MNQIDWVACFHEAIDKATTTNNERAKRAYIDLAEFYCRQVRRFDLNGGSITKN